MRVDAKLNANAGHRERLKQRFLASDPSARTEAALLELLLEEGTYRLPTSPQEEHLKAEARARGTNRQIKRYVAYLEQGVPVPPHQQPNDATLAEWIRQCKLAGLYEYGKLLFEQGGLSLDRLPENVVVDAEEDYQTCVRYLTRGVAEGGKRKARALR